MPRPLGMLGARLRVYRVRQVQGMQLEFPTTSEGLLERKFWEFHVNHPEVYRYLVQFARQWRSVGRSRLGIKALFERVRWEIGIRDDKPPPKLNNNHTAFYARLIMDRHPDLAGIFALRQQRVQSTFGPGNEELPPSEQVIGA